MPKVDTVVVHTDEDFNGLWDWAAKFHAKGMNHDDQNKCVVNFKRQLDAIINKSFEMGQRHGIK